MLTHVFLKTIFSSGSRSAQHWWANFTLWSWAPFFHPLWFYNKLFSWAWAKSHFVQNVCVFPAAFSLSFQGLCRHQSRNGRVWFGAWVAMSRALLAWFPVPQSASCLLDSFTLLLPCLRVVGLRPQGLRGVGRQGVGRWAACIWVPPIFCQASADLGASSATMSLSSLQKTVLKRTRRLLSSSSGSPPNPLIWIRWSVSGPGHGGLWHSWTSMTSWRAGLCQAAPLTKSVRGVCLSPLRRRRCPPRDDRQLRVHLAVALSILSLLQAFGGIHARKMHTLSFDFWSRNHCATPCGFHILNTKRFKDFLKCKLCVMKSFSAKVPFIVCNREKIITWAIRVMTFFLPKCYL